MESLARAAGGYDPKLVTVAKLRPLLRRGQAPVTRLLKAWKRDHRCAPVEATSDDSAGLLFPTAEPSRGAFETKPSDLDFRGTADLLAPARAAVVDASVVSPETRDRLAMLLPFDTPADKAAAHVALERARFAAFAAAYVELVGRPAGAMEIYDGAALVYGPGLSRAYARQALQRSAPSDLEQLSNGLFWRRGGRSRTRHPLWAITRGNPSIRMLGAAARAPRPKSGARATRLGVIYSRGTPSNMSSGSDAQRGPRKSTTRRSRHG